MNNLACCIDNEVEHKHKFRLNAVVQFDPTRTLTLRNRFVRDMEKRFNQLKRDITKHIVEEDALGANEKRNVFEFSKVKLINVTDIITNIFEYTRSQAKAESFMRWLDDMEERGILEQGGFGSRALGSQQAWTDQYIQSSYQKGILRARQELKAIGIPVTTGDPFGAGISTAFNQPIHVDRMGLLFTRTFEDLKGIDSVMDSQISRTLTQGMAEGLSPRTIARRLNDRVDKIGKVRARALARTEIIRAHHSANVQEYRMAGIEKVRVKAEWVTAGFNVCQICACNDGKIFTLRQIEGLIPAHPNCRCVIAPIVED